jgi:hypothetical protein
MILGGVVILGVKILEDQFLDGQLLCLVILGSLLTRILTFWAMTRTADHIPVSGAKVHRLSTFQLLMRLRPKEIQLAAAGTVQLPFLHVGGTVENFPVDEMSKGVRRQRPKKKNDVNDLPRKLDVQGRLHEQKLHRLVHNMTNPFLLGGKTPRRVRHLHLRGLHFNTAVVPLLPRKVRIINLMFTRQGHLLQLLYRRPLSLLPLLQRLLNRLLIPAMPQKFYLEAMAKEFFRRNLQGPSRKILQNILIQRPIGM